jgi:methylated-DNA-protein-cysteine methyltransferase-like protein
MSEKADKNDFFELVFAVVAQIPEGKVTSYGAIANFLKDKRAARMVGWAMNASHKQKRAIPAHRVVNQQGLLTGKMHFETPTAMQERLQAEGIEVINNQIQNFENVFWQPKIEA